MTEPQEDVRPYTAQEVADLLKTHRYTVYKLLKSGKLGAFRISNEWRIPVSELHKYMAVSNVKEGSVHVQ